MLDKMQKFQQEKEDLSDKNDELEQRIDELVKENKPSRNSITSDDDDYKTV